MVTVSDVTVVPNDIACGESVEIAATVSFAGPPIEVQVVVQIQSPCTFSNGATSFAIRRNGPSPQTIRVVESISCPVPGTRRPRIRVRARDASGFDDVGVTRVRVTC